MKNPIEPIKAYLKKVFSDLHNAVVGAIVAAVILSGGGIYLFFHNLWTQLKNIVQSPTPLWVTIILCLAIVSLYIEVVRTHKKSNDPDQSNSSPPYHKKYYTFGRYKWEVRLFKDYHTVEGIPLCAKDDLLCIKDDNWLYKCPVLSCGNKLNYKDYKVVYASAKSQIDKEVRNGNL